MGTLKRFQGSVSLLGTLLVGSGIACAQVRSFADQVNPLVGTSAEGNTFPGVGVPFGMTAWTPATSSTEKKGVVPYVYGAARIQGFRATHVLSGSATQDYGSFQIIAGSGELPQDKLLRSSRFDHAQEESHPYRYDVLLPDLHIRASVTATSRCGLLSFTFNRAGVAWAAVENLARAGDGTLTVDAEHQEVIGINPVRRIYLGNGQLTGFSGYVVVQFDHSFEAGPSWKSNGLGAGAPRSMDDLAVQRKLPSAEFIPQGTAVLFRVKKGETVRVRIGLSFVSLEEARKNLAAEMPGFDPLVAESKSHKMWDTELGRIEVEGAASNQRVFYTSLYHALQLPRVVSDASGTYPRFASGSVVQGKGEYYDDFSDWDTFRALHPLLTIIAPKRDEAMIRSLIAKGEQGGFLPIFPAWSSYTSEMIGDHTTAIIGDAFLKGLRDFDVAKAYTLMRRNAFELPSTPELYKDGRGRRALEDYLWLGYIPLENPVADAFHQKEQVSRTLEYAYDDFVLAKVAAKLGFAKDAATLSERSQNYREVIDPQTGFARGRHADGTWDSPFDPAKPYSYITEGLPFQYTFFVPQDISGLITLEGGRQAFTAKLDELFARKLYNHGTRWTISL